MKKIIVISRCMDIFHENDETQAFFHFRGTYCGRKVTSIKVVYQNSNFSLKKGSDYVLYLNYLDEIDQILIAALSKAKIINNK